MGIVAAGRNGTVVGTMPKFATLDNFAVITKFRYHSEILLSFAIIAKVLCIAKI